MFSGHVLLPRMQSCTFSDLTGKLLYLTNTLILELTFGYHQAGFNRPVLDSLETVWDRAVSLLSSSRRSSPPRLDVSTRTMYQISGGHTVLFISPCLRPCGSGSGLLASSICPLPCSLTLWLGGEGFGIVTSAEMTLWTLRANKNRQQRAALGRLNIYSDNILTAASLMIGWAVCKHGHLHVPV